MRRQVIASAAALALFMTFDGGDFAVAQEAGGGTSGTPQTTTPPATTSPAPPAGQTTTPQTTTPPTTTPTPTTPGQTTAPEAQGTKLPEVQVIQEQPKPKPKPVKQAVKPKKKPTPVAAQPAPPPPAEAAAAPEGPSYAEPVKSDSENVADRRQRNSDWEGTNRRRSRVGCRHPAHRRRHGSERSSIARARESS